MKLYAWLGKWFQQIYIKIINCMTLLRILDRNISVNRNKCCALLDLYWGSFWFVLCLYRELMPALPTDGMFAIDNMLCKNHSSVIDLVSWQWRDDRGVWHSYTSIDGKIIEVRLAMKYMTMFRHQTSRVENLLYSFSIEAL